MKLKNIPKSHLFCKEDLQLYELQNIFTSCSLWLENNMENQIATYDLVIREMPKNRNFLLFGGLEEIIEGIKKWKYSNQDIEILKKQGLTTPKLEKYLKNFKFSGDLYAMAEGSVFFPGEPIIRITGPILEGNLLTTFLMNAVCSNTVFLSKLIRGKIAAGEKKLLAGGGMRATSFESAMKGTRAGYIAGAYAAIPAFNKKYNLPAAGISINAYHAVIKSFPSEIDAFRKAAELYPNRLRPMVDTYDFDQGVLNVIKVAKELKIKNQKISAITIDSGNLYQRAVKARKMLDKAGFHDIKITVASNLDEKSIAKLMKKNIPADTFLAATSFAASIDAPTLEIVFKLAEIKDGKKIRPTAKLATKKLSYPGRKQVFRTGTKTFIKDTIGLENEKLGKPLLKKMINNGKIVYNLPSLNKIKKYTAQQVAHLPKNLHSVEKQYSYPVKISKKLNQLLEKVRQEHDAR